MDTVLNYSRVEGKDQKMFLGEGLGLERYDKQKYPVFYRLAEKMQSFMWMPQAINMMKDRGDYKEMSPTEVFIFDNNLKWQTATDSLLNRSLTLLKQHVTLPELEAAFNEWTYFESRIHSKSYTHILKGVYGNESVFWDSILSDPEIVRRIDLFKGTYDALIPETNDESEIREKIFNAVVFTNAVEGLSFYSSFICSLFYMNVLHKMEGNAKIIAQIMRDEYLHVSVTTNILKYMRDNPEEGFQDIYYRKKDYIVDVYRQIAENDKEWAAYLFSKGNLLGLNCEILSLYIEFQTNARLKTLDLPLIYPVQKTNPVGSWFDQYEDRASVQPAPQETEITSYVIGDRDTEIDFSSLEELEL